MHHYNQWVRFFILAMMMVVSMSYMAPIANAQGPVVDNLIVNGEFDSDLSDWSTTSGASWATDDYAGNSNSDSMRFSDFALTQQCVDGAGSLLLDFGSGYSPRS